MSGRTMTNTEYLLRTVRDSEHMPGWQDTFSKMKEEIIKEISPKETQVEKESSEMESLEMGDIFEK